MSKMMNIPHRDNTVMKPEHIITKPVFINKTAAAELFGVSKSTIYRWMQEVESDPKWKNLSIRPSATVTLIHVETMEEFLRSKDKSFL